MMYKRYIKRLFDVVFSLIILVLFFWLYALIALSVRLKLGSPVIFRQPRPGIIDPKTGRETIFNLYKFRTMTDERGENGVLLPDELRLSSFGRMLRAASLDELPEFFNILNGDMSLIGPRPQLVRDMVFMSEEQRKRHTVKPGLTGLAQINGRNAIDWERKIAYDLQYIKNISFVNDLKIVLKTVVIIFSHEGINEDGKATATDYGDYLLNKNLITKIEYDTKQQEAKNILALYS